MFCIRSLKHGSSRTGVLYLKDAGFQVQMTLQSGQIPAEQWEFLGSHTSFFSLFYVFRRKTISLTSVKFLLIPHNVTRVEDSMGDLASASGSVTETLSSYIMMSNLLMEE